MQTNDLESDCLEVDELLDDLDLSDGSPKLATPVEQDEKPNLLTNGWSYSSLSESQKASQVMAFVCHAVSVISYFVVSLFWPGEWLHIFWLVPLSAGLGFTAHCIYRLSNHPTILASPNEDWLHYVLTRSLGILFVAGWLLIVPTNF